MHHHLLPNQLTPDSSSTTWTEQKGDSAPGEETDGVDFINDINDLYTVVKVYSIVYTVVVYGENPIVSMTYSVLLNLNDL